MAEAIDRMTVVWDARFDKLEEKLGKINRAVYGAARKTEEAFDRANDNVQSRFGQGLAEVGTQATGVLEDIAGRAGPAGTALGAMGTAGLFGAAGVGALVIALGQAGRAAATLDEIGDTANRIGTTTDALQELRYALRVAGGDAAEADKALEGFNAKLGAVRTGIGGAKGLKPFQALGFTREELKAVEDGADLLPVIADRISTVASEADRAAILDKLGLLGLKPLLEQGGDAMRGLATEAQNLGLVFDAELVRRGSEINDTLETQAQILDVQLKSAFVDLGPVLTAAIGLIAAAARELAEFIDLFRDLESKSQRGLISERDRLLRERDELVLKYGPDVLEGRGSTPGDPRFANANRFADQGARTQFEQVTARIGQINAQLQQRQVRAREDARGGQASVIPETTAGGAATSPDRRVYNPVVPMQLADRDEFGREYRISRPDIGQADRSGVEAFQREIAEAQSRLRDTVRSGLVAGLEAARGGADDFAEYLGDKMRQQLLDKVADLLTDLIVSRQGSGGVGGALASAAAFVFGGGRAGGGPVQPGRWYDVGERGKERFYPTVPGVIVPTADQMRGASRLPQQVPVKLSIDLTGANGDETIRRIAYQAAREGTVQALRLANAAMPGRLASYQALQG